MSRERLSGQSLTIQIIKIELTIIMISMLIIVTVEVVKISYGRITVLILYNLGKNVVGTDGTVQVTIMKMVIH